VGLVVLQRCGHKHSASLLYVDTLHNDGVLSSTNEKPDIYIVTLLLIAISLSFTFHKKVPKVKNHTTASSASENTITVM
jgi:hypothetical protein